MRVALKSIAIEAAAELVIRQKVASENVDVGASIVVLRRRQSALFIYQLRKETHHPETGHDDIIEEAVIESESMSVGRVVP